MTTKFSRNLFVPKHREFNNETWTITFGECVENHAGMQKIGETEDTGFNLTDLNMAKEYAEKNEYKTELIKLNSILNPDQKNVPEDAYLLIIRKGIKLLTDKEYTDFNKEVYNTRDKVDKHAWMKGRVVNKKARYNLCYGETSQDPDYEEKKGRVIAFKDVPILDKIRKKLPELLGEKADNLLAELNYYYDTENCYIGAHGDTERSRVIGLRIGSTMNLVYQWYLQGEPVSEKIEVFLEHGDIYVMSHKAVGTDWKKRKIYTLRHSAGNC